MLSPGICTPLHYLHGCCVEIDSNLALNPKNKYVKLCPCFDLNNAFNRVNMNEKYFCVIKIFNNSSTEFYDNPINSSSHCYHMTSSPREFFFLRCVNNAQGGGIFILFQLKYPLCPTIGFVPVLRDCRVTSHPSSSFDCGQTKGRFLGMLYFDRTINRIQFE